MMGKSVLALTRGYSPKMVLSISLGPLCGKKNEMYTICQVSRPVDLTQTYGMNKSTEEKKSSKKLSQPTGFFWWNNVREASLAEGVPLE